MKQSCLDVIVYCWLRKCSVALLLLLLQVGDSLDIGPLA
jgi:hypothetical protein